MPLLDHIREALKSGVATGCTAQSGDETVTATALSGVLFGAGQSHPRGLVLEGVTIDGALDLDHLVFDGPLTFRACTIGAGLTIRQARIGSLTFIECQVGNEADSEASVDLSESTTRTIRSEGSSFSSGFVLADAVVSGSLLVHGGSCGVTTTGVSIDASAARIGGRLVVGADLQGAISLVGARVEEDIRIEAARLGADDAGYSVDAERLVAGSDLFVQDRSDLSGAIRLRSADIGGQVKVRSGTRVGSLPSGVSLDCDSLATGTDFVVHGRGTTLHGGMRLRDGRVGGGLRIQSGAQIGPGPERYALNAARISVAGDFLVEGTGTSLDGGIRLTSAFVGSQLAIRFDAVVGASTAGFSVRAFRLTAQDVALTGAELGGAVNLGSSVIARHFEVTNGTTISPPGEATAAALDLNEARIGTARLHDAVVNGGVDLRGTSVTALDDEPGFWREAAWWELDGFGVERTAGTGGVHPIEDRLRWLASTGPEMTRPADRGTYRAMARARRSKGDDDGATEMLVAMRWAHDPAWLRAILRPVRQGYAPHRAVWLLVLVWVITWVAVEVGSGLLVAADDIGQYDLGSARGLLGVDECEEQRYPCVQPALYSFDVIAPVFDLGLTDRWWPATTTHSVDAANLLAGWLLIARVLGWVLGGMFLIGALRLIGEDRRSD